VEVVKMPDSNEGICEVRIGDWHIKAQLNGDKKAALIIDGSKSKSLFTYGDMPVKFQGKAFVPDLKGSSVLLEMINGKLVKKEVVDQFPDVLKYDSAK